MTQNEFELKLIKAAFLFLLEYREADFKPESWTEVNSKLARVKIFDKGGLELLNYIRNKLDLDSVTE